MGSIKERFASWILKKGESNIFRSAAATMVGGDYVMMADNPSVYMNDGLSKNPDLFSIIDYTTKVAISVPWVLKKNGEVIEEHEIYDIWEKGNPVSRGKHVLGTAIRQRLVTGNTFILGESPENGVNQGKVKELWNLPYDMIIKKGDRQIVGYKNKFTDKVIPAEKVLHWKADSPEGDLYYGTSPLKAGRMVLQQSNDAYMANSRSLQNLGVKGLLTREGLDNAGPEKAKEVSDKLQQELGGADKFNKIPIAGGKYGYINFSVSPSDLQLLESQHRSFQTMCNLFAFPSDLLNDKDASTYNNISAMMRKLYTDLEIPLLEDFADIFHDFFVKSWGDDLSFRPDWSQIDVLQANKKELVEWLNSCWWMSAERKAEIMEEQTELKGYYIPSNLIPEGMQDIDVTEALKAYGIE